MKDGLESKDLPLRGMRAFSLDLRSDERGSFSELWQRQKFHSLGMGNFRPVQANLSTNFERGVTRGLHAEPWNKLVTIVSGKAWLAWVDLRKGEDFGSTFAIQASVGESFFIPKGIANGYQTLEKETIYHYLVDNHWSPKVKYVGLNAFDDELNIQWPIGDSESLRSEKDKNLPTFASLGDGIDV
jgi:dTDP-4-dehydrorhamnose 3,5-epimerase